MDLDLACSAGKPTMAVIGTIVGTAMVMYHERKNASGHAQGLNEELEQERSQRHNAERQVQGLQQQEQALSRNITQLQQQLNSQRSIGLAADAMYSDAKTKLENSQRELEKKRTEIKRSQLFAQGCANQLRIAQQDRLKLEKALVLPGTTLRLTVAQLGELMPELSTLHKIAASVETDTNGLKFEDFRDALTMLGASYLDYRQQIEQHPVEIKKINDSHNDERKVLNDQLIKAGASSGHYLQFLTEFANKCDDLDQLSQLMPEDFLNRIDEFMEFTQMRSQKPGVGPVINRAMINLGKILEYLKSSFEDQVRDRDGQIDSLKDKHSKETAALKKKHTEERTTDLQLLLQEQQNCRKAEDKCITLEASLKEKEQRIKALQTTLTTSRSDLDEKKGHLDSITGQLAQEKENVAKLRNADHEIRTLRLRLAVQNCKVAGKECEESVLKMDAFAKKSKLDAAAHSRRLKAAMENHSLARDSCEASVLKLAVQANSTALETATTKIQTLQNENSALRDARTQAEERLATLEGKYATNLNALIKERDHKAAEVQQATGKVSDLEQTVRTTQQDLVELRKRYDEEKSNHAAAISKLEKERDAQTIGAKELQKKQNELVASHDSEVTRLRTAHNVTKSKHSVAISLLMKEQADAIANLRSQHSAELKEKHTELTHFGDQLKASHESAIAQLTTSHQSAIAQLKVEHESAIAALGTSHEDKVSKLRTSHESTVSRLTSSNERLGAALNSTKEQLADAREQVRSANQRCHRSQEQEKLLQLQIAQMDVKIKALRKERDSANASLEQATRQFEAEKATLEAKLDAAQAPVIQYEEAIHEEEILKQADEVNTEAPRPEDSNTPMSYLPLALPENPSYLDYQEDVSAATDDWVNGLVNELTLDVRNITSRVTNKARDVATLGCKSQSVQYDLIKLEDAEHGLKLVLARMERPQVAKDPDFAKVFPSQKERTDLVFRGWAGRPRAPSCPERFLTLPLLDASESFDENSGPEDADIDDAEDPIPEDRSKDSSHDGPASHDDNEYPTDDMELPADNPDLCPTDTLPLELGEPAEDPTEELVRTVPTEEESLDLSDKSAPVEEFQAEDQIQHGGEGFEDTAVLENESNATANPDISMSSDGTPGLLVSEDATKEGHSTEVSMIQVQEPTEIPGTEAATIGSPAINEEATATVAGPSTKQQLSTTGQSDREPTKMCMYCGEHFKLQYLRKTHGPACRKVDRSTQQPGQIKCQHCRVFFEPSLIKEHEAFCSKNHQKVAHKRDCIGCGFSWGPDHVKTSEVLAHTGQCNAFQTLWGHDMAVRNYTRFGKCRHCEIIFQKDAWWDKHKSRCKHELAGNVARLNPSVPTFVPGQGFTSNALASNGP